MSPVSFAAGRSAQLLGSYRRQSDRLDASLERMMTGKRINRPADDPSGFIAAEEIRGEIVRMSAEVKGIHRERHLGRIAQSGLTAIRERLNELRGVLTEAVGTVITEDQREAYETQINDTLQAIDQIEERTGKLVEKYGGAVPDRRIAEAIRPTPSRRFGEPDGLPPAAAAPTADETARAVDSQLNAISSEQVSRATYEKYHLDMPEALLTDSIVIHAEALSQIEDLDYTEETSNFAAAQIMTQAALAALAYDSRAFAEHMETLLDGVEQSQPARLDARV